MKRLIRFFFFSRLKRTNLLSSENSTPPLNNQKKKKEYNISALIEELNCFDRRKKKKKKTQFQFDLICFGRHFSFQCRLCQATRLNLSLKLILLVLSFSLEQFVPHSFIFLDLSFILYLMHNNPFYTL